MIEFDLFHISYKPKKGISFSFLEISKTEWEFPSALIHFEYRWDKKKFYWEFLYNNQWK